MLSLNMFKNKRSFSNQVIQLLYRPAAINILNCTLFTKKNQTLFLANVTQYLTYKF